MFGTRFFESGTRRTYVVGSAWQWRRAALGLVLAAAVATVASEARAMNIVAAPQTPAMAAALAAPVPFRFDPAPRVVPAPGDLRSDYSSNPMSRAGPEVRWRGRLGPTSRVARHNFANSPFTRHLLEVLFVGS